MQLVKKSISRIFAVPAFAVFHRVTAAERGTGLTTRIVPELANEQKGGHDLVNLPASQRHLVGKTRDTGLCFPYRYDNMLTIRMDQLSSSVLSAYGMDSLPPPEKGLFLNVGQDAGPASRSTIVLYIQSNERLYKRSPPGDDSQSQGCP